MVFFRGPIVRQTSGSWTDGPQGPMHYYTDHSKHKERFLNKDGHADAGRMPIRKMRRYYRAISNICRIMRISALMHIGKYIRMAIPSIVG